MDGEPKNRRRRVVAKAMMGDLCKYSCRMEEEIKVVYVHNYLAYERVRDWKIESSRLQQMARVMSNPALAGHCGTSGR